MSGPLYQPGWYPDPSRRFEYRFHNGSLWTADVSTNGQRYVDPLGAAPTPSQPFVPSVARERNGFALASMILGIVAVSIAWMPFVVVLGAICAILALLFGVIALARARRIRVGHGFAIAGLVTGALGALLCVVGVAFSVAVVDAVERYENPADHDIEVIACELDGSTASVVGEIVNLSEDEADFTVQVAFARPGTDNAHRSARAFVDHVPAGGSATFEISRQVALDDVTCIVTDVTGPLPFGFDIET
jgi:hypothetical protein